MTGFFAEWVGEGRGHLLPEFYVIAIVAPAQAGAYHACRSPQTHVLDPRLRGDDELWGEEVGSTPISGMVRRCFQDDG